MSSKILYMRFVGEDPVIPENFFDSYLQHLLNFAEMSDVLNGSIYFNNTVFQYSFNAGSPKKAKIDNDISLTDFNFSSDNTDKKLKSLSLSLTYDSSDTVATLLDAVESILSSKKVPSAKIALGSDEQSISFKHGFFSPQTDSVADGKADQKLPDQATKKQGGKRQNQDDSAPLPNAYASAKSGEEIPPVTEQ